MQHIKDLGTRFTIWYDAKEVRFYVEDKENPQSLGTAVVYNISFPNVDSAEQYAARLV